MRRRRRRRIGRVGRVGTGYVGGEGEVWGWG